ncbi:energy transducer TonB [Echinicola rosea]|uniref:TonB C-terminal domain-containing protein n=1 Tax=Echinicola rosea TaxID=1807691 RepID=A0ABQ1UMF5_9BACT|nr:energy transducer TonB [Echinicola rosea]GGF22579.1 hypothetical protein GCM10011339_08320 [Echinicola rosea]
MNKKLLLLLFVVLGNNLFAQDFVPLQDFIPLNKYKIEIKDLDKYSAYYFEQILMDTISEKHSIIYDTLYNIDSEYIIFFSANSKPSERITITYNDSGDTTRLVYTDCINQITTYRYYDQGQKFAEYEYKSHTEISGWVVDEKGEKSTSDVDYYRPRLRVSFKDHAQFLDRNLRFPKDCRRKGIEGNVYLSLKIDSEGKLIGVDVMNPEDVDLSLQHEAVRVMSRYPWDFIPAQDRSGNPVESELKQPINFRL